MLASPFARRPGHNILLMILLVLMMERPNMKMVRSQTICNNKTDSQPSATSSASQVTASTAAGPERSGLGQWLSALLIFPAASYPVLTREIKHAPQINPRDAPLPLAPLLFPSVEDLQSKHTWSLPLFVFFLGFPVKTSHFSAKH